MKNSLFMAGLFAGMCFGLSPAYADSIKVPVNKVTPEAVGEEIGNVTFMDVDGGMDILVDLSGLTPGDHGMHIHVNPTCEPAADKDGKMVPALSAGGHWDPASTGAHKGPDNGGHKGDLPFITSDAQGKATQKLTIKGLSTKDIHGRSLMIHAGGDNYSDTPPLGGGGARFACGVIK